MNWALQTYDPHAVNHFGFDNPILYLMMAIIIIPTVFSFYYGKAYVESVERKGQKIAEKKKKKG
jgi:hypothetical protein